MSLIFIVLVMGRMRHGYNKSKIDGRREGSLRINTKSWPIHLHKVPRRVYDIFLHDNLCASIPILKSCMQSVEEDVRSKEMM